MRPLLGSHWRHSRFFVLLPTLLLGITSVCLSQEIVWRCPSLFCHQGAAGSVWCCWSLSLALADLHSSAHCGGLGSLTQFCSVGFSQSRINVKIAFEQLRFAFVVFNGILVSPLLMQGYPLYLWISGSNALDKVKDPWRASCRLKKPFEVARLTWKSCLAKWKRTMPSPKRGHWFPPRAKQWFLQKANQKRLS